MPFSRIRIARRPLFFLVCTLALVAAIGVVSLGHWNRERDDDEASESPVSAFWAERAYPLGYIPFGAREKAVREADTMRIRNQRRYAANALSATGEPAWHFVGPAPIRPEFGFAGSLTLTGHVETMALDPRNPNTIYAGAASGGVWKTTDGGANWLPLTDSLPAMDISALAVDPSASDTIYAATGYYYQSPGLFKSRDGGSTWTALPLPAIMAVTGRSAPISSIAVSPANSHILLVGFGFSGNGSSFLFGDAGLYRSTDGGLSWTSVLRANGAHTVFFDPTQPNRAFATLGMATAQTIPSGVYKSIDSGATWTAINGSGNQVLPAQASTFRKFQLAQAPSNPSVLYAAVTDGQQLVGLYKTTDTGQSWSQLPKAPVFCTACIWTDALAVHPKNPDILFAAGQDLWRSTDGGASWSSSPVWLHADHHTLAFSADGNRLFSANDGGLLVTANPTAASPAWNSLNSNLALVEFYQGMSTHPSNLNVAFGGTQDNSSIQFQNGHWSATTSAWSQCGDGFTTQIDFRNPTVVFFACLGASRVFKSVDGGHTMQPASSGITGDVPGISRVLTMDPTSTNRLYFGGRKVFQTTDSAGSWKVISPDLTSGSGQITAIAVAPGDPNVLYAGATSHDIGTGGSESFVFQPGSVWTTANALAGSSASWQIANSGLPNRWVSRIAVDPRDPSTAYAVFSGFNSSGTPGHVFKTVNRGQTWADIGSGLPDIPMNDIVVDPKQPSTMYVASDIGVFQTNDAGATWSQLGSGLPRVSVTGLSLQAASCTLRATTWGRGAWDLSIGVCESAPAITPGGIGPVFSASSTIQPGSWVSIYGTNLADSTAVWNGEFPTFLGDVSVTINRKPAYLWFVSPNQINLQAPDDTTTGIVNVVVMNNRGSSTSTVRLAPASPSFSLLGDGRHVAGVIATPDGSGAYGGGTYDLVGPAGAFTFSTRPVTEGETLVLYGVGFGPTNPLVPAGSPFSGAAPLTNAVVVTIGGVQAKVSFGGITGAGLYQFNLIVPNTGSGDKSLQATVGGVQTLPGPLIAVQ